MPWRAEHDKYLGSKEWKNKRLKAFAHHGKECACCGSADKLEVHHVSYITYNRRGKGKELMKELIPLCQLHHCLIHELISSFRESHKSDFSYNWEKASKDALKYLLSAAYRKNINLDKKSAPIKKLKKSYNKTNKKIREKNRRKKKRLRDAERDGRKNNSYYNKR